MYLFYKYTYKCLVDTSYKYFENQMSSNFKIFTAQLTSEDQRKPKHVADPHDRFLFHYYPIFD